MKINFEITYDAGKLQREIKNIIKDTVKGFSSAYVEGSKKAIKEGNFTPLRKSTIDVRKAGTSRGGKGAYGKKTNSTKPLQHTGRLLRGIKQLKNGDMSVHEYGTFHLGDLQTAEQIERKSGTAYTTASDSMIPNKKVPIRNWFQMDKELGKKAISKFQKLIDNNFKK
tara:strand:- start:27 stop:530 length:504 start_codon:yes stop_codon:yes gene_type:complete